MELLPGTVLRHRYEIHRALGEGGMGTTYLAVDLLRSERLALKLLRASTSAHIDSFRTEFATLSGRIHPRLCRVFDFEVVARPNSYPLYFYTCEFIDGVTLDRFATGRPWTDVLRPIIDTLEALAFLHGQGIRHGDVKPLNILVDSEGRGVLIDLGCSQPIQGPALEQIPGTPAYLAPELLKWHRADQRADLFALGVTLERLCSRCVDPAPEQVLRLQQRLCEPEPQARPADAQEALEALGVERSIATSCWTPVVRLVGREEPLRLFDQLLTATLQRKAEPRVLCLAGPEGIGRSRVLQEMKWGAQLRCDVVEGSASEAKAVGGMLRRATDGAVNVTDLGGVIAAYELLAKRDTPIVLVLDDAHLLPEEQYELLIALARSLASSTRVALVYSALEPPVLPAETVLVAKLGPLGEEELSEWAAGLLPKERLGDALRLTGGYPAAVHSLLAHLSYGDVSVDDLGRIALEAPLSDRRLTTLQSLAAPARQAIALFAVLDGSVRGEDLALCNCTLDAIAELLDKGWVGPEGSGWRLLRSGEASRILAASDPQVVLELHRGVARQLASRAQQAAAQPELASALLSRQVYHLAQAGDVREAEAVLRSARRHYSRDPQGWARGVQALLELHSTWENAEALAAIQDASGHPERALAVLEAWAQGEVSPVVSCRMAACCLRMGDTTRVLELCAAAEAGELEPELRARVADLRARTLIKKAEYAEALATARGALEDSLPPALRADLHDDVGVAASYLGDHDTARTHLEAASKLHEEIANPRALLRSISYRAFLDYRAGKTEAAAEAYARVLDLAEGHGMADQVARAALNVGTTRHQQGRWGDAWQHYDRGLRIAIALGQGSAELTLRFNLAKLYADIGLFDRAALAATALQPKAAEAGIPFLAYAALTVRAEAALGSKQLAEAQLWLQQARAGFQEGGELRERLEVDIALAELALERGDSEAALVLAQGACEESERLDAEDLRARSLLSRARAQEGNQAQAEEDLSQALALAQSARQIPLQAEVLGALQIQARQQGALDKSRVYQQQAFELWNQMAATLPETAREAFWAHYRRAAVASDSGLGETTIREATQQPSRLVDRHVEPIAALAALVRGSASLLEVAGRAAEIALALVEGDRATIAIREGEEEKPLLRTIALAASPDTRASAIGLSRSICEQVLSSGRVVHSVEAREDERFADAPSVLSLGLSSVCALPLRGHDRVLGVLEVDRSSQAGRFDDQEQTALQMLADLVAIALSLGRLKEEIAQQDRELASARRKLADLQRTQAEEISRLQSEVTGRVVTTHHDFSAIVGRGPALRAVLTSLDRIIASSASVLISGESGTGKELIARAIHFNGPRRDKPFVTINCGAIPEQLLESELFGHVRGAFTGADRDKPGLLVSASGGTVFLDEIGELPLGMQVKLLRVLQDGQVRPVGTAKAIPSDFRLICATNRKLREEVEAQRFRGDLYYRINVVEVELPPLRERIEDIPELARHLVRKIGAQLQRPVPALTKSALRALGSYGWPGNVRELENVLTKTMLLLDREEIRGTDLRLSEAPPASKAARSRQEFQRNEAEQLAAALRASGWNVSAVARQFGMPRGSLYRKLERYGLLHKR